MRMYFDENDNLADSNLLLKISKIKHLKTLQQGVLYMNTLGSFRKYESEGMGDKEEGLLCKGSDFIVSINGSEISDVKNTAIYCYDKIPIFCIVSVPLTKVNDKEYEYVIDNQILKDFMLDPNEEYGVFLIGKDVFAHKIREKLNTTEYAWCLDKVEYTDDVSVPPKDKRYKIAFRKRTKFSHQSEWRLAIFTNVEGHYELDIGTLEDCSSIVPIKDINTDMRIGVKLNETNER